MQLKRLQFQSGFTLVELMIAMAIFSVLLLVMSAGVLQLVRIYDAGHEIRDTQEAARTIAKEMTDDTHDAQLLDMGTQNGQPSVCMYQTIQQLKGLPDGQPPIQQLIGSEYYVVPFGTFPNSFAMHRATVTTTYNPAVLPGCAGTTAPNGGLTDDHVITPSSVTVKLFTPGLTPIPTPSLEARLLTLSMSVESVYAQQPTDFILNSATIPNFDQCVGGPGSQYCSITNIQLSALKHNEANQ